jgi:glycosyltransferase involved in cell wall biosynthesis
MNNVFVIMLVKNEVDILPYNIEYLQTQDIDHFFIADNMSSDGTKESLNELANKYGNMEVFDDEYYFHEQGRKMNTWISMCYDRGADIIVPIDADEVWYSKVKGQTLGQTLKEVTEPAIFVASAVDFIPTSNDKPSNNPIESMIYQKDTSDSFSSVAFTKYPGSFIMEGNHDVINHPGKRMGGLIGIKHYQYRSFEQFKRKVRNGRETIATMPEYIASHWRRLGSLSEEELMIWWQNYINQPVKLYD